MGCTRRYSSFYDFFWQDSGASQGPFSARQNALTPENLLANTTRECRRAQKNGSHRICPWAVPCAFSKDPLALGKMLEQITPENLHSEHDTGVPQGSHLRRMVVTGFVPGRSDIVWLNFTPQVGHEQAGHRPALVLSPVEYNSKTNLALLCPITSRVKGYPFEVSLPSGSPVQGVVLADQIKSLDWNARDARLECRTMPQVVNEVLEKVKLLLD